MCVDLSQKPGQNIVDVLTADGLISSVDIETLNQKNLIGMKKQDFSNKFLKNSKNV